MCGIFGHINNSVIDLDGCRKALTTLTHRGPDQAGEYTTDAIFIGHRRLSILDLSENGRQPMFSESTVITINGEIYNYPALKSELQKKHRFKSNSDSEIVLYGYEEWGLELLLEKMDGMYALVIYDKKRQQLHLAKDRYGIKPLYYTHSSEGFTWASELKAIVNLIGENNLQVDHTALFDFLTYLYIPTPKTLYKDVCKLPPAHFLTYDLSRRLVSIKAYWKLEVKSSQISLSEASAQVKQLISSSVNEQLISDVPVGFFLSGGIDSSIVVAAASSLSKDVHTYSIGFDVESHNETDFAKVIADLFKTHHNEKILHREEASNLVENIKGWYDEPFADTSAIPSYLVSAFAKKSATVVLTGDGGDELFGGYDWYLRFQKYKKSHLSFLSFLKKPISKIKQTNVYSLLGRLANQFEYRICDDMELYAKLLGGLLKHEKSNYRKLWNIPADYDDYWYFNKFYRADLGSLKRLQYLDFHTYLHDDIFTKVDRVSMSVSLECRVPFMKKELVEFAFSLPEKILYCDNELKGLLKVAYKNILPQEILFRKKRGFNIPLKQWNKDFLKKDKNQQEFILRLFELIGN